MCFLKVLIRTCSSRTVARETSRTCEEFMLIYDIRVLCTSRVHICLRTSESYGLNYLCSVQDLLKISMKDAEEDDKDFFDAMEEIWQTLNPSRKFVDVLRDKGAPWFHRMIEHMEAKFPQRPHNEKHTNQQVSEADISATRKRLRDQAQEGHLSECARVQRAQEEKCKIPTDLTQTDEQADAEKDSDQKAKRRQTTITEHFALMRCEGPERKV